MINFPFFSWFELVLYYIEPRVLTDTQCDNMTGVNIAAGGTNWSCGMREDSQEAVTSKLRPSIFPGKLELEEERAPEVKGFRQKEHLARIPGNKR